MRCPTICVGRSPGTAVSEMAHWERHPAHPQGPGVLLQSALAVAARHQREYCNRLLRFWFEKGTALSGYTKADLKRIQDKLNSRPRPTLDLDTPAQRLAALISQAA